MLMKATLGLLAGLLVSTGLTAHATDFRSTDVQPDGYPTVEAVRFMGQTLGKLTGGKLGIKVFSSSALGSEKDTIEQTKIGALAMTRVNISPMNNICPTTVVPTLPFLFHSKEHMRKTLDGARSMYTVKKPIKTVADMKGMKIRVQQSDLWVSVMEAMGANATPMPFGEVYTALKTGLVDGAENNIPSYESTRHFEVAKYYSKTEHSMAPEILLFSKKVWDGLSESDRKAVRQAAKESVPYMRKLWDEREEKSLATVKAGGAQIVDVNKASFEGVMKPVYDKFITDAKLRALVKKIQDSK
jgi:TRAP-type C4-dicarboxylate transport system substrate-binding protein